MAPRDELLQQAFPDEILRRMARAARAPSLTTGSGERQVVDPNTVLRRIAGNVLENMARATTAVADGDGARTINQSILRKSMDALGLTKADLYLFPPKDERFPRCTSHRQHKATAKQAARPAGRRAPSRQRGTAAEREIEFETRAEKDTCVYGEYGPFLRLLKDVVTAYGTRFTISSAAVSSIQLLCEGLLIKVLSYAWFMLTEMSKGHAGAAKPSRKTLNGRDVATAHTVLKECLPILWAEPNPPTPVGAAVVAPPARAKAKPTSKPTAKAKSKPRAKAKPASKRAPRSKRARDAVA